MSPVWSYVLTAVGVLGLLLAGSRKRVGWALGLAAQPLWAVYAVVTGQWGFILSAVVYGGVYLRNWLKWRREAERVMVAPAWRTHREMVSYSPGRYPLGSGQQTVASAVKPARSRPKPPPPDAGAPPRGHSLDPQDRCDRATGHHSTPHRGCVLR